MNCDFFRKECGILFVVGAACGIAGLKIAKTDKARKLAVKTIAQGMMIKDNTMEGVTNLREEAEEICAEARAVAKASSECNCDCKCEAE
ncbi:MAG: DUF6110 family protein [Clostridia bacterium]